VQLRRCVNIHTSNLRLFLLCNNCLSGHHQVRKCFLFLYVLIMSIFCVMASFLYPVFNMRFQYLELVLLILSVSICSLYLVWKALPVCSMFLSISFGRCHFCCIFLWLSFHYVLHSERNIYLSVLEQFCDFSYLFHCMWKWPSLFPGVVNRCQYFVFVVLGIL
jgi:hypothetical protein